VAWKVLERAAHAGGMMAVDKGLSLRSHNCRIR
jgi:hypothetical protein